MFVPQRKLESQLLKRRLTGAPCSGRSELGSEAGSCPSIRLPASLQQSQSLGRTISRSSLTRIWSRMFPGTCRWLTPVCHERAAKASGWSRTPLPSLAFRPTALFLPVASLPFFALEFVGPAPSCASFLGPWGGYSLRSLPAGSSQFVFFPSFLARAGGQHMQITGDLIHNLKNLVKKKH